jgi:hypothetical protein
MQIVVITFVKTQQTAKPGTMLLEGRTMTKISIAIKVTIAMLAVAALTHARKLGVFHSLWIRRFS